MAFDLKHNKLHFLSIFFCTLTRGFRINRVSKFNQIELKKWSTLLLENLSDCLVCAPEKFQVSLTGFEPMPSAMPVQCFFQLNYEATRVTWAGQFVGLMCSHERNDEWRNVCELHKHFFHSIKLITNGNWTKWIWEKQKSNMAATRPLSCDAHFSDIYG